PGRRRPGPRPRRRRRSGRASAPDLVEQVGRVRRATDGGAPVVRQEEPRALPVEAAAGPRLERDQWEEAGSPGREGLAPAGVEDLLEACDEGGEVHGAALDAGRWW